MSSPSTKIERAESVDNTCTVCHDQIEIHAVGPCDHPVCFRCSTRMRVLCEQMDCPICRSPMPQVAFVYKRTRFQDINLRDCILNRKYKLFYQDEHVEDQYRGLLEYRCKICNKNPEKSFTVLQTHMRKQHQLFACDLCVSHLQIFPFERKFYSRKDLAIHRRIGDPDDKSYKGHPLCEFCDTRYNDNDELLKHLRKDHFFCYFCDQACSNAYYDQYADLMKHFNEFHFLCTEGECSSPTTRFTHAFATEIDLKAHKASVHNKNLTKAQSREARLIEVDFQLPPRRQGHGRAAGITSDDFEDARQGAAMRRRGGDRPNINRRRDREDADLQRALEASRDLNSHQEERPPVQERIPDPINDFPSLNGSTPTSYTPPLDSAVREHKAPTGEEDFPSLSSAVKSSGPTSQPQNKAYASVMHFQQETKAPTVTKKESKPISLGSVGNVRRERWSANAPIKTEEDYPSLGGVTVGSNSLSLGGTHTKNWGKKSHGNVVGNSVRGNSSVNQNFKSFDNQENSSRSIKSAPLSRKVITDDSEFPQLNTDGKKVNGAFGSPFSEWSNPYSSSKGKKSSRVEKCDDNSFQLPDSYFKSYEETSSTSSGNDGAMSSITNGYDNSSKQLPPPSNSNDFPGLPQREDKKSEAGSKKKKKRPKKAENKLVKTLADTKASDNDPSASLNEIAQTLIVNSVETAPPKQDNKGESTSLKSKCSKSNPPDWFDNVPSELSLNGDNGPDKDKEPLEMSEVKQISKENSGEDHSFPSLHAMSTSVQQPKPPPGFAMESVHPSTAGVNLSVPPGFSSQCTHRMAGFPPPGFTPNAVFIQPPEFKSRNLKLIQDIRAALETVEDGFSTFRVLSSQFRQGIMEASDYYFSCLNLMGEPKFVQQFPELISLLPDIGKQNELLTIHQTTRSEKSKKSSEVLKISGNSLTHASWSSAQTLSPCPTCSQVLLAGDFQHHLLQHGDSVNFPRLGGTGSAHTDTSGAVLPKGSWIKAA